MDKTMILIWFLGLAGVIIISVVAYLVYRVSIIERMREILNLILK